MKTILNSLLKLAGFKKKDERENPVWSDLGMTTCEERAWWMDYTSNTYEGKGAIVDLGSWFGSTACALAEGLRSNKNQHARNQPIHAIDLFVWHPWMDVCVVGTPFEGKLKAGDDFMHIFHQQTKRYGNQIIGIKEDLNKYIWNGGRIEFLLIDAMKSWGLANRIIEQYYTHLIPGTSFILQQDFAHFYAYWIHLIQYRMRDHFEPIEDTIKNFSVAFKLIRPIPQHLLTSKLSLDDFTTEEINRAFAYSRSIVSTENIPHIEACHVMAIFAKQGKEDAISLFDEHRKKYGEHITIGQLRTYLFSE
jgi:hypothetical protein